MKLLSAEESSNRYPKVFFKYERLRASKLDLENVNESLTALTVTPRFCYHNNPICTFLSQSVSVISSYFQLIFFLQG